MVNRFYSKLTLVGAAAITAFAATPAFAQEVPEHGVFIPQAGNVIRPV